MNVLIFADGDSIWTKSVIEHTLCSYDDNVTILSTKLVSKYAEFYKKNNISIVYRRKMLGKVGSLFIGISNLDTISKGYDIFCAHYITNASIRVLTIAKKYCKKTIFIFWGSDILRRTKKSIRRIYAFNTVDRICMSTREMEKKFHELYGMKFDNKIRKINFGSNGIELLTDGQLEMKEIRRRYNIDESKIVISIGYNKMCSQQHLKVLNVIKTLLPELREKIHIILRLTYGNGDNNYINKIKALVDESGCSSSIFESYMSDIEVAEVVSITDIFIHAQTTDARSASMCEHLYAGSLVIVPSWIQYSEIEGKVFYLTFEKFEDLEDLISNNLVHKQNSIYHEKLKRNRIELYDLCSWKSQVPDWRKLYLD